MGTTDTPQKRRPQNVHQHTHTSISSTSIRQASPQASTERRLAREQTRPGGGREKRSWRGTPCAVAASSAGNACTLFVTHPSQPHPTFRNEDIPLGEARPVRGMASHFFRTQAAVKGGASEQGEEGRGALLSLTHPPVRACCLSMVDVDPHILCAQDPPFPGLAA